MAMTTLGAVQPGGKMRAEAAVLDVHIHVGAAARQVPWPATPRGSPSLD